MITHIKKDTLNDYQLTKKEFLKLWFENYECFTSFHETTIFTMFCELNLLIEKLVMIKGTKEDNIFRFRLNLNPKEEVDLKRILLRRKDIVFDYILKNGSFSPYTHLYQFYLQYLPYKLNEIEKSILLDGYIHMLEDLLADKAFITSKRIALEQKLNLHNF